MSKERNEIGDQLVRINIAWNEYEETMGENAALEVACNEEGVDSDWFYSNFVDHADYINKECTRIWKEKGLLQEGA